MIPTMSTRDTATIRINRTIPGHLPVEDIEIEVSGVICGDHVEGLYVEEITATVIGDTYFIEGYGPDNQLLKDAEVAFANGVSIELTEAEQDEAQEAILDGDASIGASLAEDEAVELDRQHR